MCVTALLLNRKDALHVSDGHRRCIQPSTAEAAAGVTGVGVVTGGAIAGALGVTIPLDAG
jgi:hypothetical protein